MLFAVYSGMEIVNGVAPIAPFDDTNEQCAMLFAVYSGMEIVYGVHLYHRLMIPMSNEQCCLEFILEWRFLMA